MSDSAGLSPWLGRMTALWYITWSELPNRGDSLNVNFLVRLQPYPGYLAICSQPPERGASAAFADQNNRLIKDVLNDGDEGLSCSHAAR